MNWFRRLTTTVLVCFLASGCASEQLKPTQFFQTPTSPIQTITDTQTLTSQVPAISATSTLETPVEKTATMTKTSIFENLDPRSGDDQMLKRNAPVNSVEWMSADPPSLIIRTVLPSPCYMLRAVVHPPDEQNTIIIDFYSLLNKEKMCAQVITAKEVEIGLPDFGEGDYSIAINGKVYTEIILSNTSSD